MGNVVSEKRLEELLVQDVVNYHWESERLRQLRAKFLDAAVSRSLAKVLHPIFLGGGVDGQHIPQSQQNPNRSSELTDLVNRFAAGDPEAIERVEKSLQRAGLTMDAVRAQTLADNIDVIAKMDDMIFAATQHRGGAQHEIERGRARLADTLQRATSDIVDAEIVQPEKRVPRRRT